MAYTTNGYTTAAWSAWSLVDKTALNTALSYNDSLNPCNITSIAHSGKYWVIGLYGDATHPALAYSADGLTWTPVTNIPSGVKSGMYVVYANKMFVAIVDSLIYSTIWSIDGIKWKSGAPAGTILGYSNKLYYINSKWIAISTVDVSSNYLLKYSSDGINWNSANLNTLKKSVKGVVYNGTRWIIIGQTATTNLYVEYSTNITAPSSEWTTVTIYNSGSSINHPIPFFYDSSYTYLYLSNLPILYKSSDGISWSSIASSAFGFYTDVVLVSNQDPINNTLVYARESTTSALSFYYVSSGQLGQNLFKSNSNNNNVTLPNAIGFAIPDRYPDAPTITSVTANYNEIKIFFTEAVVFGVGASYISTYLCSLDGGNTFFDTSQNVSPLIIPQSKINKTSVPVNVNVYIQAFNDIGYTSPDSLAFNINIPAYPCFLESTQILTDRGYVPIEKLTNRHLVKTVSHGFKRVWKTGSRIIDHSATDERIKEQLYVCSKKAFPEAFEDLVLTGCHSILVDEWSSEDEKERATEANGGNVYITDNYYRLPACADLRTTVYPTPGEYTIYHVALENSDYYMNYGIYANGVLVESCSKRYLKELSGMDLK
jgi:hypothetical protein